VFPQKSPDWVRRGKPAAETHRPGTPHRLRRASSAKRKISLSPSENLNHWNVRMPRKLVTYEVMMLHHISDQKHHIKMPFLINNHLSTLHFPFISTFHTHDRPHRIVRRCFPVVGSRPYAQTQVRWCSEQSLWICQRDRVRVLLFSATHKSMSKSG
jgi:hypothetical protein